MNFIFVSPHFPKTYWNFCDRLRCNGEPVGGGIRNGYFTVRRKWRKGDVVELSLDMEPRLVAADPRVEADRGMLAVERGPLVYCAEWPDNPGLDLFSVLLPRKPRLSVGGGKAPGGAPMIEAGVQKLSYDGDGRLQTSDAVLRLIPYYAWANRGEGMMAVWLPCEAGAVRLGPPVQLGTNEFLDK